MHCAEASSCATVLQATQRSRRQIDRVGEAAVALEIAHSDAPGLDMGKLAAERQDIRSEMLAERLARALDALIAAKLQGRSDRDSQLSVLFELYEDEILTKSEVRERAGLEPDDFQAQLRAYRLKARQR